MSARAFLERARVSGIYRPVAERIRDFNEVERPFSDREIFDQAGRCMNCGIPFCHGSGCPLGNRIFDINAAAARGDWKEAWALLNSTSPMPEFTSRICPALCEGSCTASLATEAVMIRQIEKAVTDHAFELDLVKPVFPARRTGCRVAVIGSGPAGLAAAIELNRLGHLVTVYERNARPGGLLRYGIPDFKLAKSLVDRRVALMALSGIEFVCDTRIGEDIGAEYLLRRSDALVIATGTPIARDLKIPGRELGGIYPALELLGNQNRVISGELSAHPIRLEGRRVLVIGGGDTGSDCVGTANRLGAAAVTQIEIMPKPPVERSPSTPWPQWPYLLRTSSSHHEGCERFWNLNSRRFIGSVGQVTGVEVVDVEWEFAPTGRPLRFRESGGKSRVLECDAVFLALGFLRRDREETLRGYGLEPQAGIFLAGDAASGPGLVVRAIADGLRVARETDEFLGGQR